MIRVVTTLTVSRGRGRMLVNNDVHVPPSFAGEVVGEPSDSGLESCRSEALSLCRVCLSLLMWVRLFSLL